MAAGRRYPLDGGWYDVGYGTVAVLIFLPCSLCSTSLFLRALVPSGLASGSEVMTNDVPVVPARGLTSLKKWTAPLSFLTSFLSVLAYGASNPLPGMSFLIKLLNNTPAEDSNYGNIAECAAGTSGQTSEWYITEVTSQLIVHDFGCWDVPILHGSTSTSWRNFVHGRRDCVQSCGSHSGHILLILVGLKRTWIRSCRLNW